MLHAVSALILAFLVALPHVAHPAGSVGTLAITNRLEEVIQRVRQKFPDVPQWSTAEAEERLSIAPSAAPLLFDVRESAEFAVSHLPGARNVSPDATAASVLAAVPSNSTILVYCSVGYRSSALAERIRKVGHADVANLEGGIFLWANEGRVLVSDSGTSVRVHGYNASWARLLNPGKRILPRKPEGAD